MVVSQMSTQYRTVPVEADLEDNARGIELLEHHPKSTQDYETSTFSHQTDGSSHRNGKGPTYELIPSPNEGMQTSRIDYSTDPDDFATSQLPLRSKNQKFLTGWRFGVFLSLLCVTLTCIFNVAVTIWAWQRSQNSGVFDAIPLFGGNCKKIRKMNVWFHLIINVLGTLLLCASNYCMQVLSAPSREELVVAHAKRRWLHIGVPSLRNLRHIDRKRAVIWIILLVSSMPLHLIFNSVVFTDFGANEYAVVPTTEEWLEGEAYDSSSFTNFDMDRIANITEQVDLYLPNLLDEIQLETGEFVPRYQKLSAEECFDRYDNQFLSDIGNLYLVQDGATVWRNLEVEVAVFNRSGEFTWHNISEYKASKPEQLGDSWAQNSGRLDRQFPYLSSPRFFPSNEWRCPAHAMGTCDIGNEYQVPSNRSLWQPYERPIKYCLVEQVAGSCRVLFTFPFAILVIVCNVIKAICMALLLFGFRKHTPLLTMGDAVASFLERPDPETRGRCLHSRQLIVKRWRWETTNGAKNSELDVEPERFDPMRKRWGSAPSTARWFATYFW